MKKIIAIIVMLLISIALAAVGLAASGVFDPPQADSQMESVQQAPTKATELPEASEQRVARMAKIVAEEDFISLLESQGYYIDEINQAMARLIRTAAVYDLTAQELSQLYALVADGYDLNKAMEAWEFTTHTDRPRDIAFVRDILDCAQENHILGDYWAASAFNQLTNNRGGVLEDGDVHRYLEQGLTIDDIVAADYMSRMGVKTIQQILDARLAGTEWSTIAQEIYPEQDIQAATFSETAELDQIYDCVVKARVTGMTVAQVASDLPEAEKQVIAKQAEAQAVMETLSIQEGMNEEVVSAAQEKLPGVPTQEVRALLTEGYTIRELEQANKTAQEQHQSLVDSVR